MLKCYKTFFVIHKLLPYKFLENVYSFQRFLVKIQVFPPKKAISDRTIFLDFLYMIV